MANVPLTKCWQRVPLHGSVVLNLSWKYFDCCAFIQPPSLPSPFRLDSPTSSSNIVSHTPGAFVDYRSAALPDDSTCSTSSTYVFQIRFCGFRMSVRLSVVLPTRGRHAESQSIATGGVPFVCLFARCFAFLSVARLFPCWFRILFTFAISNDICRSH